MPGTEKSGPWSPGLSSTIPKRLMPRATIFDPRFTLVSWQEAFELSSMTGFSPETFATFRPDRVALHRCLIRVTAELYVPDGPNYADFGVNLRKMAGAIFEHAVQPNFEKLNGTFDEELSRATDTAKELLNALNTPLERAVQPSFFSRFFSRPPPKSPVTADTQIELLSDEPENPLHAFLLGYIARKSLVRAADIDWLVPICARISAQSATDARIAHIIDRDIDTAVQRLGFKSLPPQSAPVVLNAKGASASGKSSIRGAQKQIADNLNLDWQDFAIISPDYWRKHLLDYQSLGPDYKYAAMLTGQELAIIDKKLDALMTERAQSGRVPHMLIDRFRFDSFQTKGKSADDTRLLTRFGNKVYLFFMITPPGETVLRAWTRGLETGRYKAVDDLLFHNIEAYSGMPDLFFSWVKEKSRWINFEFLDNSVPMGQIPRTIAFGRNGHLAITDIVKFCDIERFRQVNVDATNEFEVLSRQLSPGEAMGMVRRVIKELPSVDITEPGTQNVIVQARKDQVLVFDDAKARKIPGLMDAIPNARVSPRQELLAGNIGETIGTF